MAYENDFTYLKKDISIPRVSSNNMKLPWRFEILYCLLHYTFVLYEYQFIVFILIDGCVQSKRQNSENWYSFYGYLFFCWNGWRRHHKKIYTPWSLLFHWNNAVFVNWNRHCQGTSVDKQDITLDFFTVIFSLKLFLIILESFIVYSYFFLLLTLCIGNKEFSEILDITSPLT